MKEYRGDRSLPGHRFLVDEGGATLPLVGLMFIMLVVVAGAATDFSRAYMVKSRLGDALDAAGLAAAHEVGTTGFNTYVQQFFDANYPPGYMGSTVTLNPPVLSGLNNSTLTLSASATLDTTFLKLIGQNDMSIASAAEVTRQTMPLDVVLAMDVSGSMNWNDPSGNKRITSTIFAAKELVNILFGAQTTANLLNIGLVPWNGKVNIIENGNPYAPGTVTTTNVAAYTNPVIGASTTIYHSDNSPTVPLLTVPPAAWGGCVYTRFTDDGISNDGDDVMPPLADWPGWEPVDETLSGTPCFNRGITRLINVKADITTAIDQLTSPTGHTNAVEGLGWAWRVLSPGLPFDDANPFPVANQQRAIVLLTDGEQTGSTNDGYKEVFGSGTGAGGAVGDGKMNDRLEALANNIKAGGTRIYVIQYANGSGAIATLMKKVATEPNDPYYFYAPDAAALTAVFKAIADDLSELRLSK